MPALPTRPLLLTLRWLLLGLSCLIGQAAYSQGPPLPVELISFEARCVNRDVTLTWSTASERDNEYFAVEASCDARAWREIGRVPGHGTTHALNTYTFQELPVTDPVQHRYYRLRQVDSSGAVSFSTVRFVQLSLLPLAVQATPNPFHDVLALAVTGASTPTALVTLTDMLGQLAWQQTVPLPDECAANVVHLMLAGLRRGTYLLTFTAGPARHRLRVVQQ